MHWSCKFLSIPYQELNCAEFVEFVLKKQFNIDFTFPQNRGSVFSQSDQLKKEFLNYVYPEKTNEPEEGDLVLMNGIRKMCHVGILVKKKNDFFVLHSQKNLGCACLHKLKDISNYGLTLEGIYKWQK